MKTINKTIDKEIKLENYIQSYKPEEILFFDIETTGFSAYHSDLYLIGCIYFNGKNYTFKQFFAEDKYEQREILKSFFELVRNFKCLVHFNGDTFDIPYLSKKAKQLNLSLATLPTLDSFDIYKKAKILKGIIDIENFKLKTIEKFLGINRKDTFSGGELINKYKEYKITKNKNLEDILLLHNKEDIIGMLDVIKILNYTNTFDNLSKGDFKISNMEKKEDMLVFNLEMDKIPLNLKIKKRDYFFNFIKDKTIKIHTKIINDTLLYFFDNNKDYYYIPSKDQVIHKTLAKKLPPNKREKSKKSNCYVKHKGNFISLSKCLVNAKLFKRKYKEKKYFIELNNDNLKLALKENIKYLF